MKTKHTTILINWNSERSMKRATRLKAKLENAGATLINTISTPNTAAFIYQH